MAEDSFHEVLFPSDISYGSSGGPAFNTTVISLSSGFEQRNINWSEAKASYEASHGIKTADQMDELLDFFYARYGRAYGFRYKDWGDFKIEDSMVAVADGVSKRFQIVKRYEPATDHFYDRPIRKIAPGTIEDISVRRIGQHSPELLSTDDWVIDVNTGLLTLEPTLPRGSEIYIGYCEFHVPVRFDSDEMKVTQDSYATQSWPSIPLVELKLRHNNVSAGPLV